MFIIILIILIVAAVTIFSVQNAAPVTVSFLYWKFDASLAIVIFLAVLTGMIITILLSLPIRFKQSLKKKPATDGE
jgi:uncharacterized integral membrane protein